MNCVYVDPGPARTHIQQHLAAGQSLRGLAKQCDVHHVILSRLATHKTSRIETGAATRILTTPITPKPPRPTHLGCQRRLDALAYLGWSIPAIAQRCDIRPAGLYKSLELRRFSTHTAHALDRTYPTLARTRGPDRRVTTRAIRAGKLPPWAWTDRNIDSPTAKPDLHHTRQGPPTPTLAAALTVRPMWSAAYHRAMTGHEPLRQVA